MNLDVSTWKISKWNLYVHMNTVILAYMFMCFSGEWNTKDIGDEEKWLVSLAVLPFWILFEVALYVILTR